MFLLELIFAINVIQLQAQEVETTYPTTISLQYAVNDTYNPRYSSHSIGGNWGLVVDHHFEGTSMGLTAGIQYALIHSSFDRGITSPSEAIEFGLLESSFGVWHYPLPQTEAFKINASFIHGLVIKEDTSRNRYNIPTFAIGAEYVLPLDTSLALAAGWRLKYFGLDDFDFSSLLTNVLYFKVGIKG